MIRINRIVIVFLVFVVCLSFTGCSDRCSKDDIISFVNKEYIGINQMVITNQFEDLKLSSIVKEVYVNDDYIEFYCGGTGMGGQTTYSGFYYFYDDEINYVKEVLSTLIKNVPNSSLFIQEGDGYVWRQENGDDELYFQHIIDHYYYFELIC